MKFTSSTAAAPLMLAAALAACSDTETSAIPESAVAPIPPFAEPYGPAGGEAAYAAAVALLDTLSDMQAATLILPIDSPARRNWSNLPAGIVDFGRNGLRLGDLQPDQLAAIFAFPSAGLGAHGYDTVGQVVAAEAVLAESTLASMFKWSATNYWLAFFGKPTAKGAWGWQFGGHHIAVNASLEGGRIVSLSPTFIGIEPASFDFQGRRYAPLVCRLTYA